MVDEVLTQRKGHAASMLVFERERAERIGRRQTTLIILAAAGLLARARAGFWPAQTIGRRQMKVKCVIRYEIDPFQKEAFRKYAENWGRIIPRCGGHLVGYFLPHEGTNNVAWGLIAFESLAAYETYRARLKSDAEGRANFEMAQSQRLILREERNFVEVVEGTFGRPATVGGLA